MPHRCCVPGCRGNYSSEKRKVSTFSFPKDNDLKQKWLNAIRRDNFQPSQASKVCELHFHPQDIERTSSFFNDQTGIMVTAKLLIPRLAKGAIPAVFPGRPSLSKPTPCQREAPNLRRQRQESAAVNTAIEESIKCREQYQDKISIKTLEELKKKISDIHCPSGWTAIAKTTTVNFILFNDKPQPGMTCCIQINADLFLSIFSRERELKTIAGKALPCVMGNIRDVEKMIELADTRFGSCTHNTTVQELTEMTNNLLETLQSKLPEKKVCLKFMQEQLRLLNGRRPIYSREMVLFCGSLYSLSPHAYKFLRNSERLMTPSCCTLKRLRGSSSTNPNVEQRHSNLVHYIATNEELVILRPEDKTTELGN